MRKVFCLFICIAACLVWVSLSTAAEKTKAAKTEKPSKVGETLFQEHCAMCHPAGGNPASPKKTLKAKDMSANKITKAEDIVKLMRKPGPGMMKFDEKKVSDKDAKEIAEYILKTFK